MFIFIFLSGEGDVVRCFCCNLGLSEWAAADDPWIQKSHNHNPNIFLTSKASLYGCMTVRYYIFF
jgi:hypothetical protein